MLQPTLLEEWNCFMAVVITFSGVSSGDDSSFVSSVCTSDPAVPDGEEGGLTSSYRNATATAILDEADR